MPTSRTPPRLALALAGLLALASAARAQEPATQAAATLGAAKSAALPTAAAAVDQSDSDSDSDSDEGDETPEEARARAELEELHRAELRAGLLADNPAARDAIALGLGEMNPLSQDLGAALGPSVDGSPLADPAPVGGVFASLPELAGISEEALRAKYDIPVELNDAVVAYIRFFQTGVREHFEKWLARSTRFMPMMRQILEKEGLPLDLVYLSMIESGFNAYAYSWAKASGLWQFVVGTSRRYGLVSDFWVDERRDPARATVAAARYLKDLNKRFHGNWFLAWAGYNAGEGRIDRAIKRENTTDFWKMRYQGRTLRAETKHYVPKLIAAALIAKHPERFGFHVAYQEPWQVDEVQVPGATDLSVIAKAAGITLEEVRDLNPALRRSCTPPSGWTVKLPKGRAPVFTENFAKLSPEQRLVVAQHKVEKGESLSKIARAYGVSEKSILTSNGLRSARQVRVGSLLVIQVRKSQGLVAGKSLEDPRAERRKARPQGRVLASAKPAKHAAASPRTRAGQYAVKSGDTLWSIANQFGTTVDRLKELNGLRGRRARSLRIGQLLAVRDDA